MTLAVITGAFTGIGPELARIARPDGHQTVMVANKPAIHQAAADLGAEAVEADLPLRKELLRFWPRWPGATPIC